MPSKPSHPSAVLKFIDLEATVEDSEDDSDGSEDGSQTDFVVANELVDDAPSDKWLRWDDLIDREYDAEHLVDVAEELRKRYGGPAYSVQDNLEDHPVTFLPTNDDFIFKIKVRLTAQTGMERDIVFAILQKSSSAPSTHGILSAFCRDAIKGAIFVEAKSIVAVQNVLKGMPGVDVTRSNGAGYAITAVDVQDRHLLLDMAFAGMLPIKNYSWARIKSGRYRGDLTLVTNVDPATLVCSVLLVPRIAMSGKRKRGVRVPQCLFDPYAIGQTFGHHSLEKQNRFWVFKGEFYECGCLCKNIHMIGLSIEGINATPQELQSFHACGYWDKAATSISPIKIGDRIRVVSGSFVGMVGEISEVLAMTVKFTVHGEKKDSREVLTREVRKAFEVGDFVQVARGWDRGLEGFLVHLEGDSAVIFVLPANVGSSAKRDGKEFVAKAVDIEWKSNATTFLDVHVATTDLPNVHSRYDPAHPMGLPYTPPDPSLELANKTIDRYKHMEVRIIKGEAKLHFGIIKGTHKTREGEDLFEVLTSTRAINTVTTYRARDLQERFTKMPIDKARWIPLSFRNSRFFEPSSPNRSRPSTPVPSPETLPEPTGIVGSPVLRAGTPITDFIPTPEKPAAGNWLLDRRLVLKKLDVRIQGTTTTYPHWQGGKFEGQLGWFILTSRAQSVEESAVVKTGFTENRAQLLIRHLVPERSTEIPTYWPTNITPVSVFSVPGARVVVIGPDLEGCTDYIGSYALVSRAPSPLPPNVGLVQIASPGIYWGRYIYLNVDSICRSTPIPSPINWFGTLVHS